MRKAKKTLIVLLAIIAVIYSVPYKYKNPAINNYLLNYYLPSHTSVYFWPANFVPKCVTATYQIPKGQLFLIDPTAKTVDEARANIVMAMILKHKLVFDAAATASYSGISFVMFSFPPRQGIILADVD